jgi:hypothetical protein
MDYCIVFPVSVAGKRASLLSKNRTVPILRCLLFTHLFPPLTKFPDGSGKSSLSSSTTNASVRSTFFASPLVVQSTTSRRNSGLFTKHLGRLKNKSPRLGQTTSIIIIIIIYLFNLFSFIQALIFF